MNIAELINEIASTQDGSPKQKRYFNRLLSETDKLPIFKAPRFSASDRDDAKNLTRMAICGCDRSNGTNAKLIRKLVISAENCDRDYLINRYKSLVKRIFKNKLADICNENKPHLSLDAKLNSDNQETFINLIPDRRSSGLDKSIEQEEKQYVVNLINYIDEDPNRLLKQCHPEGYPQCNAKVLIKERFLQDTSKKWKELAAELNTSVGTMTERFFYPRCLPLLRQIAREFNVC